MVNLDLSAIYQQLMDFARLDSFWQSFDSVYSTNYDFASAETLRLQWANGDFSGLPQVDILQTEGLGSAVASYNPSKNTIDLSEDFFLTASSAQLNDLILSEIGYFVANLVQAGNAPEQGRNLGDFITPLSTMQGAGEFKTLAFSDSADLVLNSGNIQGIRQGLTSLLFNLNSSFSQKLGSNGLFGQLSSALLENLKQNSGFSLLQTLSTDIDQLFGFDTTLTPEEIAKRITQKLLDRGLMGAKATVTQSTADQLRYQLAFNSKNTNNFNLSTDLGISNLDLSFTGAVGLDLDLSLVLDFGIDLRTNVFFVDTVRENELSANVTLQNTQDLVGELGFLSLTASDRSPTEKTFRSSLGFSLNLLDEPDDADDLLNFSQLSTITRLNPLLTGFLSLNPNLKLGSESLTYLPKLTTELAFNTKYDFDTNDFVDANNPEISPTVNFNNVQLDLSSVFGENSLIFGLLSKVYEVIKPVAEVLDALTKNIDFITGDFPALGLNSDDFKEIVNKFLGTRGGGLNDDIFPIFKEDKRITILDLLIVGGSIYERITGKDVEVSELIKSIPLIKIVTEFTTTLEKSKELGSGKLGFGNFSFTLDNAEASALANVGANGISQPIFSGTVDSNSISNVKNKLSGFGEGFAFPLIDDPKIVFKYLTGQEDVDLFTYDLPTFDFKLNFDDLVNIPIFGPLGFTIGAGIEMQAFAGSPDFGFDIQGLTSGSNNLGDIISSGFYLVDKVGGVEKPEVIIGGNISAGVSIAPPGVGSSLIKLGGKISAQADFDLINGDDPNKVFLKELWFPFFVIDGKIFAQLNATVNIKLSTVLRILEALRTTQDASDLLLKKYLEGAVKKAGFSPEFVGGALQIVNVVTKPLEVIEEIVDRIPIGGRVGRFFKQAFKTVTRTVKKVVGTVTETVIAGSELLDSVSVGLDLNSPELILWQASFSNGSNGGGRNNGTTGYDYLYGSIGGAEDTLTVNIGDRVTRDIITPPNALPVLITVNKYGIEDRVFVFVADNFINAFSDANGDSLTKIKIISLSANGSLKLGNNAVTINQEIAVANLGSLTFVPNANFNGNTSFSWNGFDGTNYANAAATVAIAITAVNDLPVISNINKSGNTNSSVAFSAPDFTSKFTDADGNSLSKIKIVSLPNGGVLKLGNVNVSLNQEIPTSSLSSLSFVPNSGFGGNTSFAWNGFDGTDYASNWAWVNLTYPVIPAITLAVNPSSVTEDGVTNLVYTFTRSGPTTNALTVNYGITGTADSADYSGATPGSNKTITFAAGFSTVSLTINPTADTTVEPDQTVILTLASGTGYSVGTTNGVTGTITNDDDPLPAITLAVNPSSVTEDGISNLVYTFTRSGPTTNALTVNYGITGTADSADYSGATPGSNKTITFAAGSSTVSLTINPTADTTVEPDQTVILTLASGTGYTVGTTNGVIGTITNDDSNNDNFANRISVSGTVVSTSGTNVGFTGETGEPNQSGSLNSAWWSWTAPVSGNVTIDTIGSNFDTVLSVYTGNALNALALVPNGQNDDIGGGVVQSRVSFGATSGTTYQIAVDGYDSTTGNINLNILPSKSTSVTIAVSPSSVTEDGPNSLIFTLTRTGNLNSALTVNYALSGSASLPFTSGEDYRIIGSAANIANFAVGSDTTTIIVDPIADFNNEDNETVTVTINSSSGYTIGTQASVTGTIQNDDFKNNDNFANRTKVSGQNLFVTGTNVGFTGETGEPNQSGAINSAWWSWTAPVSGVVLISTFGSNFDTFLSIYTGNTLNTLTLEDFNDDESPGITVSEVFLEVSSNTTYQIAVDGFDNLTGEIGLSIGYEEVFFNSPLSLNNATTFALSTEEIATIPVNADFEKSTIQNSIIAFTNTDFEKSTTEDSVITFTATDFSTAFSQNLTKIKITELPNASAGSLQLITPEIIFNIDLNEEIALADLDKLVFIPNENFNGNASFSWTGFNGTAFVPTPAKVNLTITPVADRPTLADVNKYGPASVVTFTQNDFIQKFSDADGDALTKIKITSLPTNGILKLGNTNVDFDQEIPVASLNNLTFTPNAGFSESTSFGWNGFDGTNYAFFDASVNLTLNNPGNSLNTAFNIGQLLETKRYTNSIGQAGSSDYYRLEMLDFGLLTVLLEDLSSNVDLQLLSVSGEVLQSSTQSETQSERVDFAVDPGIYFIRVLQVDAASTDYTLRLTPNIDEVVRIVHLGDGIDGEVIAVLKPAFPGAITEFSQEFSGIKKISAGGGKGNDIIELQPGVKSAAELMGGEGNDQLQGGDGRDSLSGGVGDDTLIGGLGADTLNGDDGIDTVDYSASNAAVTANLTTQIASGGHAQGDRLIGIENIEGSDFNDNLTGSDADNLLLGGTGNDTLNGGAGNDILVGGLGNDSMSGGTGNDTYLVDSLGDVVRETSTLSTEIDDVESIVDYTLPANVENLLLNGSVAVRGTGNALNNTIIGNNLNNILDGGAGDDLLIGGLGNDTMTGGSGNDTYLVDSLGDVVIETSTLATEIDTVESSVNFTLGANLEDLILTDGAIIGIGNNLNNFISGNEANNTLIGNAGNDTLFGDLGNDILIAVNSTNSSPGKGEIDLFAGDLGADRFILGDANWLGYDDGISSPGSNDYADIIDFESNEGDTIQLKGRSSDYILNVLGQDTQLLLNKPGNEPDELIGIIRGKTNLNLNGSYFTYILGQDEDPPSITLAVNPSSVTEDGVTNLVYTFTRSGPTTNALTVNYGITGTADSADYSGATPGSNKTITFAAGSSTVSLTINPTADTTVEPDQTVILTLASGTGYTVGTTNGVIGTITNDDSNNDNFANRISVSGTVVSTSGTNVGFTGETGEPNQFGALNSAWWSWTAPVSGNVTIDTIGSNFDTVLSVYTGNALNALALVPNGLNDDIGGDVVQSRVSFSAISGTTYQIAVDGYDNFTGNINLNILLSTSPSVTIAVSPGSVTEDGVTNLIYTFTRSGPTTNALTVNYGITGTADSADYSGATPGSNKTITFAAGSSTVSLTINPTADTTVEPDQTVILTLASGTGYTIGTTNGVTGTITNDDIFPPTLFAIAHNTFSNINNGWFVKEGTLENTFSITSWAGWKPTALGDFNFDGQSDVIVTQPSTGYNALWIMNQGQVSWVAGLPSWGTEWQVVDTGDFNSDGNTDILVTNPSTGWNAVWNMYGTTYGSYTSASFWGGWQAVAAGDMNNDGNMDILVNYPSQGWNAVHLMNGQGGLISTEILPSWGKDWKITGTADINGDGKTDILANYPSQGWNVAWIMNDTQFGYQQGFPGGFGTEVVL
ncbi:beta strand repeat-containing protein [Synechocystis salina]|uniref:VCBS repeat-containing protein n=1 Tax=Synechocystis salina LEGE 00031 TaxID=1828736 RepID=A0ABR9VXN8_9SYNC|nr:FG-GAP-like repeat-containing protein [Synechocystis salina]MBE9242639.1 VCBS repeat-containing protein [Synechocystis salina LEGE 00041]MBE9255648.1 VCBS repeat-containing protein [Synechocystis salina LEGE 00031]